MKKEQWTVISNKEEGAPGRLEIGPGGKGIFYDMASDGTSATVFHYEIRRGLGWVDFEDKWKTTGGLIPIHQDKLFLFRVREDYPEPGTWFTDSFVLFPSQQKENEGILSRLYASEVQTNSLWQERHDGKAVQAAITAAGSTQGKCAHFLSVPESTFRGWLNKPSWDTNRLAQIGLFLDTDLISPYLTGFRGRAWVAVPDGSGLLHFILNSPNEENHEK